MPGAVENTTETQVFLDVGGLGESVAPNVERCGSRQVKQTFSQERRIMDRMVGTRSR